MHAYKMHAHEMYAHKVHACKMHAREISLLGHAESNNVGACLDARQPEVVNFEIYEKLQFQTEINCEITHKFFSAKPPRLSY